MKIFKLVGFSCLLALSVSGCLKTRAQIKEGEQPESNQAVPANPQAVEPPGGYAIDEIKGEITRMTGRIEELERNQQKGAGDDVTKKLEQRVVELENAQAAMLEEIKKLQSKAPVADDPSAFETGKNQYEAGNFEGAIETLSGYLKSPKAKKAEEATFLRAECYFNTKQYKKAIVDYSKFPEKFTKSRRMPSALYKIGLSFEALGMKDDAKGFYQELVDKFPKAPEAKTARAKLK